MRVEVRALVAAQQDFQATNMRVWSAALTFTSAALVNLVSTAGSRESHALFTYAVIEQTTIRFLFGQHTVRQQNRRNTVKNRPMSILP